MKRNLLFISRYPEIIDEFQGILEEKQIETEIAQNGTDAMELLKQKEYQILVTDLNLDGYNGDKILSYVNQKFPDTICMLYTNSISAVQLGFYLNKRDVFRVFLRPVNFRQEFMQALEEAYEFYDLKKRDRDSRQERLKQLEGNRKAIAEIEKIIENQNESWKDFEVNDMNTLRYGKFATILASESANYCKEHTTQVSRPYAFMSYPKEPTEEFSTSNAFKQFISCIIGNDDAVDMWENVLTQMRSDGLDEYIQRQNENFAKSQN